MTRDGWFCVVLFGLALWGMWSMESRIKDLQRRIEKLEGSTKNKSHESN
jgi:hypothetical protein